MDNFNLFVENFLQTLIGENSSSVGNFFSEYYKEASTKQQSSPLTSLREFLQNKIKMDVWPDGSYSFFKAVQEAEYRKSGESINYQLNITVNSKPGGSFKSLNLIFLVDFLFFVLEQSTIQPIKQHFLTAGFRQSTPPAPGSTPVSASAPAPASASAPAPASASASSSAPAPAPAASSQPSNNSSSTHPGLNSATIRRLANLIRKKQNTSP